jgi:hypothetical protein
LTKEGKGGIPPTELNLVDGKLVYLENDETALVFDGMEVREYHFSELQAPQKTEGVASTKVEKETSNTKKSEGVVELEEIDDDAVSIGSRGGTDPTSTTTTSAAISEKHEPKSPERSLTSLKPETEEFLHRLRAMQFIGAGCFGGSLGVMPISSLKYAWKPQVKVPSSRPAGEMEDYDDLYYIPAEDRNTVMVQSPHGVLRKPKQQGPHLFYIKQGNCPVSSSTTRPN